MHYTHACKLNNEVWIYLWVCYSFSHVAGIVLQHPLVYVKFAAKMVAWLIFWTFSSSIFWSLRLKFELFPYCEIKRDYCQNFDCVSVFFPMKFSTMMYPYVEGVPGKERNKLQECMVGAFFAINIIGRSGFMQLYFESHNLVYLISKHTT